jgi:hypothetical protein
MPNAFCKAAPVATVPGAFPNAPVPAPAVLPAQVVAPPNTGRNPTLAPHSTGRGRNGSQGAYGGPAGAAYVRCYNCQGMGHIAKDCPSPVGVCGGVRRGAGALGGGGSVSSADVHGGTVCG